MFAIKTAIDGEWVCSACRASLPMSHGFPRPCMACLMKAPIGASLRHTPSGPGTELKKLLAKIGITATEGCRCNSRAAIMDDNERKSPGWCEANIDTIVGWLREEATNRRMPFIDAAGKLLVRRAIKNAKNHS